MERTINTTDAKNALKTARETAREVTSDIKAEAKDRVSEARNKVESFIGDLKNDERIEKLKKASGKAIDSSSEFVREYPLPTVLGAVGLGIVAGYLLGRSSRR